jgi:hypothetical protein
MKGVNDFIAKAVTLTVPGMGLLNAAQAAAVRAMRGGCTGRESGVDGWHTM